MARGPVERLVLRDRWIVVGAMAVIVALASFYTYAGVGMSMPALGMTRMAGSIGEPMEMGSRTGWVPSYWVINFLMWWVMMVAMMTPSAAPTLLLYTAIKRVGPDQDKAVLFSFFFLGGYLLAWGGFSVLASGLQWASEAIGLTDAKMMTLKSRHFAAIVLILAGAYQFSGLKDSCLAHCRAPAQFLADHSRPGHWGALRTGTHHGAYCLGCCWALMALLFVGGIMNLYWIGGLALYVLVEKVIAGGRSFARISGAALVLVGAWILLPLSG